MGVILKNIDIKSIAKVDNITYTNVQVVVLNPLPSEAKLNSSLADGFVQVFNDTVEILEIADGDIDLIENVGKFAIGSDQKVKIILEIDTYTTITEASTALKNYKVVYQVKDGSMFASDKFDVSVIDRGTGNQILNTVILSGDKVLSYMKTNTESLDMSISNPIQFTVVPQFADIA